MARRHSATTVLIAAWICGVALVRSAALNDRAPAYYAYVEQASLAAFVPEGSPGALFARNLETGNVQQLYRSELGAIFLLKASLDGSRVGFLDRSLQYDLPSSAATFTERGRAGAESSVLRVIDLRGTELASFSEVRDFAWSSDGTQIALVTGRYTGDYDPYGDTATWVVDLARRTRTKLMDGGNQVTWPAFDRNIYVWVTPADERVARVLMPEQEVQETPLKSIYFSPSGAYYYRSAPGRQAIFRAADQTEVRTPAMTSFSSYDLLGWSPARNVLWMRVALRSQPAASPERTDVLFDLDNDTITHLGHGIVGWAGADQMLRQGADGPEAVKIADLAAEQG